MPVLISMRDTLEACFDEEDARIREDITGIFLGVAEELRQLPSEHTESVLDEYAREWDYI